MTEAQRTRSSRRYARCSRSRHRCSPEPPVAQRRTHTNTKHIHGTHICMCASTGPVIRRSISIDDGTGRLRPAGHARPEEWLLLLLHRGRTSWWQRRDAAAASTSRSAVDNKLQYLSTESLQPASDIPCSHSTILVVTAATLTASFPAIGNPRSRQVESHPPSQATA